MAIFRVSFEIEVEAETSVDAAKRVENCCKQTSHHWQYYVQNADTNKIHSVDLDEDESCMVCDADNYSPMIKN